ncbi:MAG: transketolase [Saprospiraceae bacterium]|nr:transketolase [Saprospiraceae bacterium]
MDRIKDLQAIASQVRRDIVRQVHACQSGHPGGSLGCADFLTALYFEVMQHDTAFQMRGSNEDVFFLSNGHISPVWYSVLARSGYFPVSELATFRQLNTRLQGHPTTHEGLPGIRVASGSLGQGLSVAIGMALSKKLDRDDKLVYVLTGDGELQEAGLGSDDVCCHHKVDNLVVTVDVNGRQIDGDTNSVLSLGDLEAKWQAFGWKVLHMQGNVMSNVVNQLHEAKNATRQGLPVVILMNTEMGYPIDFMVGSHKWHGIAPNDEQLASALSQLAETLGDY